MPKPRMLVTGATGKTGAPTALLLLQKGYPVRALVHQEDARSASLMEAARKSVSARSKIRSPCRKPSKACNERTFARRLNPVRSGARRSLPKRRRTANSRLSWC